MAFAAAAAQQWKPSLRSRDAASAVDSSQDHEGKWFAEAMQGDGGNNPEVPSTPAEKPTGPVWEKADCWTGPSKHYSQKSFKGQQSNVKFGKAREDIEAYAQGVEPFEDINDEMFRVPFSDMTIFLPRRWCSSAAPRPPCSNSRTGA